MFKNATLYTIGPDWACPDLSAMEQALSAATFHPCGPTGALVESIHGQRIACFQLETKSVPASAIKREMDKRTAAIEAETGRKPGRKASKELKEQITFDLLPHAFPKTSRVLVWFDLHPVRCSNHRRACAVVAPRTAAAEREACAKLVQKKAAIQFGTSIWAYAHSLYRQSILSIPYRLAILCR